MFWTDCELIPELTSSKCNWKGNQKGKGTDETPLCQQHVSYSSISNSQNRSLISENGFLYTKPTRYNVNIHYMYIALLLRVYKPYNYWF